MANGDGSQGVDSVGFGALYPAPAGSGTSADGVIQVSAGPVGYLGSPWSNASGTAQSVPMGIPDRADYPAYSNAPRLVPSSVYEINIPKWYHTLGMRPQYNSVVEQLKAAGLITNNDPSLAEVQAAYHQIVIGASFNTQYTPDQFLQLQAAQGAYAQHVAATSTSSSTNTSNVNDSRTSITGPLDAKAIVNNAVGQYLGRAASPEEVKNFLSILNEQERVNPSTTTGTNTTSGKTTTTQTAATSDTMTPGTSREPAVSTSGKPAHTTSSTTSNQSSNLTSQGGIDAAASGQLAEDFAKSRGAYAETQASTTGMDWLRDAIMSTKNSRMI